VAETPKGAKHICLDVETGHADEKDIKVAQDLWTPPSNMKTKEGLEAAFKAAVGEVAKDDPKRSAKVEKLEKKRDDGLQKIEDCRAEAMERIRTKSALLDAAPIISMAICTEAENAVFVAAKAKGLDKIKGMPAGVYSFKNEREMLIGIREWLDARALATTVLIGFNIVRFDLPKLRNAYLRHRLIPPQVLAPEARDSGVEVYDVMKQFVRFYSPESSDSFYISQEEVTRRLGMPGHKHIVRGAEVPDLWKAGKVKEVVTYNFLDTADAYSVFLTMTGQFNEDGKAA
jgi:hypothetical protein